MLERIDFMSIHFSAKRPTRLKTTNIKEENWKKTTEDFKNFENKGEQFTKEVRNIKKHLKELNELYNDNQKKKEKNKLTKKNCEKEKELADKINSGVSNMARLLEEIGDTWGKIRGSGILDSENKINSNYLHTIESDTSEKEEDSDSE